MHIVCSVVLLSGMGGHMICVHERIVWDRKMADEKMRYDMVVWGSGNAHVMAGDCWRLKTEFAI